MKKNIRNIVVALCAIFAFYSCQKIDQVNKAEGLKSSTGDQVLLLDNEIDEDSFTSEIIFHRHYDANLTEQESEALWEEDLNGLEIEKSLKAYSTEWFHRVATRTGTQTDNGTDDEVKCLIRYRTDIGSYTKSWTILDNSGDDREGGWDYYLVRSTISDRAIQWIELIYAQISLKGTDGWFVTNFNVYDSPSFQNIPATGTTSIYSQPNRWLDNETSSGVDIYSTGSIGTGRLTF